jgi:hypothetical protein
VHEYAPVALLESPDQNSVPVAHDGTLLPHVSKAHLPTVAVSKAPLRNGFESARVRALVTLLAGAPAPLRSQLDRAFLGGEGKGILVAMRDGPTLEFGTSRRIAAKWASATRVLGAPSASGASTIDVRLPERPAASGFGQENAQAGAANPQL